MTDTQLYLAIGIPIITNATMILLLQASMHRQLDALSSSLSQRIDRLEKRLENVEADLKLLTGKVYEMMAGRNQ
jgi:chaperonin cofactor prefoldin